MKNFSKLIFRIQQWPYGTVKTMTADFNKETIEVRNGSCMIFQHSDECSRLEKAIRSCRLETWPSAMESPVLQGTVWELELYDDQKLARSCHGIDQYPPHFDDFLEAVTPCFRKVSCGNWDSL